MRKIWSTANVKVYGGDVAEEGFLRALSDLIGDYSYTNVSISSGKSGSSRSRQEGKERIFDVSNLAELDRGRAVVLASDAPAPWSAPCPGTPGPTGKPWRRPSRSTAPGRRKTKCPSLQQLPPPPGSPGRRNNGAPSPTATPRRLRRGRTAAVR
ncbi:TraM recognition domain-containing protein [Arthrobacter sp. 2MCAF15]